MAAEDARIDAKSLMAIDSITSSLLSQLEVQTQLALVLLESAPDAQREPLIERLGEVRGRLIRLRTRLLGRNVPKLVAVADGESRLADEESCEASRLVR
jgi:hypothetical protein